MVTASTLSLDLKKGRKSLSYEYTAAEACLYYRYVALTRRAVMMRLSTDLYPTLDTMHMTMGYSQRGALLRDEDQ